MILQEKLNFLLEKYGVNKKVILHQESVTVDRQEIPLLPWRNERRFIELKSIAQDGTLVGISTIRACRIDKKAQSIDHLIYRELDLCQWLVESPVVEITTFKNDCTANVVAKLENGIICTIEVAATLSADTLPIDKHEIISQRGIACDRVVDTQLPQQSVYVYTHKENPDAYIDVDFELFGLSIEEIALVRQAFDAAKDSTIAQELQKSAVVLEYLMGLSQQSEFQVCNIRREGIQ